MDTVTHALTGAVIGYCGFRQRGGRAALWTCIAASEFPDIDIALLGANYETYLQWHRGATHSIVLLPLWATLIAAAFWVGSGRRNFRLLWCAAAAGIASHLALDWITSYGTMLLWPLTDRRFALSWVFILDPYVWALLGIVLWSALRLKSVRTVRLGMVVVCGYVLFCGMARIHVIAVTRIRATDRVGVFAEPMNPLRWTVVRDRGDEIEWGDGNQTARFVQFHDNNLLPKAETTDAVKLFRWFAEFPLVEKLQDHGRTVLRYRDLRFRTVMPWGEVSEGMFVVAKVTFDDHGNVLGSELANDNSR